MTCGLCGGGIRVFLDLGNVALAGAFTQKPEEHARYRLRVAKCMKCHAVQLADKMDPERMFRSYRYFSSATETMREHFRSYAWMVVERFRPKSVLEIGCNDGVLLKPLRDLGVSALGVDPSETAGDDTLNEYFTEALAKTLEPVDVVLANNVFAHIPDINDALRGVKAVLKDDGVFIFEVNHLLKMVKGLQYDWIYHEHAYYHSLLSLSVLFRKHGMTIFDAEEISTHAGSVRFYACKDARTSSKRVTMLLADELEHGLDKDETFTAFARDVHAHRKELRGAIDRLKAQGKRIAGYGACGRAAAMMQWCGIGREHLEYMVDDARQKQGWFMPGSNLPIYGRSMLSEAPVDYLLVFAWSFLGEIRKKVKRPMIVPLPYVRVVGERKTEWAEMDGIGQWVAA